MQIKWKISETKVAKTENFNRKFYGYFFFLCILSENICQLNYAKFEKWIGKRLTVKSDTAYQGRSNAMLFKVENCTI